MLLLMVNNSLPREKQVSIAKEIKESTGEDCILLESGAVELSYIQTKEEKEKEKQEFWESLSTLLEKLLKESSNAGNSDSLPPGWRNRLPW